MPRQSRKPIAASHHRMPLSFLKGAALLLQIAAEFARSHRLKYRTYLSYNKDICVLFQDYLWNVLDHDADAVARRSLCPFWAEERDVRFGWQADIRSVHTGGRL